MSNVPMSLRSRLDDAFQVISAPDMADALHRPAVALFEKAYEVRLKDRSAEDNRPEHELVVLANTMRIGWHSGRERASGQPFSLSELRVAVAVSLLHDLRFIPRVTETMIREAAERGDDAEAGRLRETKARQRLDHMRGSAEDARAILLDTPRLLDEGEIRQVLGYIALHDLWKLGWPYPASSDWLAVCCLEGDALWPLHDDLGPRADLERRGMSDPTREQLRSEAAANLDNQLRAYRANFSCTAERLQDGETIMRTTEGARILDELRLRWGI